MELVKPERLRAGDRVAAVTLSWGGPGTFPWRYEAGKRQLEAEFGVEVVETRHALREPAWIAANPEARAADLMEAFADPSIRGIVSTIGGDDSVRILPFLDLGVIRANPKVFLGFSDTTVTHFACLRAGLGSFYGPSFMAGFAENGGLFPYMTDSLRRTVFEAEPVGEVRPNEGGWTAERLEWGEPENQERRRALTPSSGWRWLQGSGVRAGPLIGGCAEVLEFLKGTGFWPSPEAWDGAILFLETSEVMPSPTYVTWWMRNYAAQGILHRLSGILVGRPYGPTTEAEFHAYDAAVMRVVHDEEGLTELPVVTRMDFGHTDPVFTLPIGRTGVIDCERRTFSIPESAVV